MESDGLSLLPSVFQVLANPKLMLPDDTSLEKLLDWLTKLIIQGDGQYIIQHQPSLLQFLHNVRTKSEAIEPIVFSFALKLTGLLAAKDEIFNLLEEQGMLQYMFKPDSWHKLNLWKNATIRCGWLQGLWNMLQHKQAIDFFCKEGFIKLILCLQNDESIFIASLTNEVLTHFLNSTMLSNNLENVEQHCSPVRCDWASDVTKVMKHVAKSLASEEQSVVLSGLRLLAVALAQCKEPLKEMLWHCVLEPLELLGGLLDCSLSQALMAVLDAAARSHLFVKPECRLEALIKAILYSRNTNTSVQCAACILQLENCPESLKLKAADILLYPLLFMTSGTLHPHGPDCYDSVLENQLSERKSCVSLLTQSLFSIADLICKKLLDNIPVQLVTSSVISLLRMCLGQPSSTLQEGATSYHLIGCCKVQRSALDVLGSLTVYKENSDLIHEALTVLLLYLQCPDLHATVLEKAHQTTLKWFSICSPSPDLWKTVSQDFFPLLKKHVCDGRWEVRDSTLEFIMQLTAMLKENGKYAEAVCNNDMISVLLTSLSDVEGYVRASAVAALGEVLTSTALQLSTSLQEEAVTHLLAILKQDTESFPRRAVVKVFTSWLKIPLPFILDNSLSSVFSVGCNDFDWEVKVHTLEVADVFMESSHTFQSSERTCIMQGLNNMMVLGVFDLLLNCLFECDRPVSEKACALLLKLKTFMSEKLSVGHNDLTLEISRYNWGIEILQRYDKTQQDEETNGLTGETASYCPDWPKKMGLFKILELIDLEDMKCVLSLSSDHVINSPQSLMEDILFASEQSEENVVDCY